MIIAIDTETQGLNAQNFIMGCIAYPDNTHEVFKTQKSMIERIYDLGIEHKNKKETLYIYSHNMQFDYIVTFFGNMNKDDIIFCVDPTIIDRREREGTKRSYIKFLSTTSLFRGPLSDLAPIVGMEKGETPEWLMQDEWYTYNEEEFNEAAKYMINDTKVVLEYVFQLKQRLKDHNVGVRWLLTAAQVGISAVLADLKKSEYASDIFFNIPRGQFYIGSQTNLQKEGAKGGRVSAFKLGEFEGCSQIDINSQYPYCITKEPFPILHSQKITYEPLRFDDVDTIINQYGVSKCIVEANDHPFGVLPILTYEDDAAYPRKKGQIICGTWSHIELRAAVKRGYTIKHIFWTFSWNTLPENPLKNIVDKFYTMKSTGDKLDNHFAKMVLNGFIGKFKQERVDTDHQWENIENRELLEKDGWVPIDFSGEHILFEKILGISPKPYFCPIIYLTTTAAARVMLLEAIENIAAEFGNESIIYTDTDSVTFVGDADKLSNTFKYDNSMGNWKIAYHNVPVHSRGKKSCLIGDVIKLSGVRKKDASIEGFKEGSITYKRMIGLRGSPNAEDIGVFREHVRNLNETEALHKEREAEYARRSIFIDEKTTNVQEVHNALKWILPKEDTPLPPAQASSLL